MDREDLGEALRTAVAVLAIGLAAGIAFAVTLTVAALLLSMVMT